MAVRYVVNELTNSPSTWPVWGIQLIICQWDNCLFILLRNECQLINPCLQLLETQAKTFEPETALNQKITQFERDENGHILLTAENGDRHLTKTLILAMGHGIHVPSYTNP